LLILGVLAVALVPPLVETIQRLLFTAADSVEWAYVLATDNPYRDQPRLPRGGFTAARARLAHAVGTLAPQPLEPTTIEAPSTTGSLVDAPRTCSRAARSFSPSASS
jgi:type II secretory pathway pseudopilin PulG